MVPLLFTTDHNDRVSEGMRRPDQMDVIVLAANTFASVVVPDGANHVKFSGSSTFFAKYTADVMTSAVYNAGTVNAAGVCSENGAEMNPGLRTLTSVTALGLIMPGGGYVSMSWFG